MPRRKITEPHYAEALEQLSRVRKAGGMRLDAQAEAGFYAARGPVVEDDGTSWVPLFGVTRHNTDVINRRGAWIYRTKGKAGADLSVPPYYWRMLQRQRDFEAEASKVKRQLAARWLYKSRKLKADKDAERIREIARTITSGSRHKRIARAAGCSVAKVKRALAERK